ncbi:hypothetical protein AKO1_002279 [Acrasis kona]|uniref:F-box domain-containing protein n=1 Tax=Acrasis kona TaxID=1008807 RepID=A0AAW2ZPE5_9EUKA
MDSAPIFDDIPDEVLTEILCYMPTRYVLLTMTSCRRFLTLAASFLLNNRGIDYLHQLNIKIPSKGLTSLLNYISPNQLFVLCLYEDGALNSSCWPAIVESIWRNKDSLRSLGLNVQNLTPNELEMFSELQVPNLNTLRMKFKPNQVNINNTNINSIWKFTSKCELLETLSLETPQFIKINYSQEDFITTLSRLKSLSMIGCLIAQPLSMMGRGPNTSPTQELVYQSLTQLCPNLHTLKANCHQGGIVVDFSDPNEILRFAGELNHIEVGASIINFVNHDRVDWNEFSLPKIHCAHIHASHQLNVPPNVIVPKIVPNITQLVINKYLMVAKFLKYCRQLTSVKIDTDTSVLSIEQEKDALDELESTSASHMKSLSIVNSTMSLDYLVCLVTACHNLKRLDINEASSVAGTRTFTMCQIENIKITNCFMTLPMIFSLVTSCSEHLRMLELSYIDPYIPCVQVGIKLYEPVLFPNLKCLLLNFGEKVPSHHVSFALEELCSFQLPSLKKLDLKSRQDNVIDQVNLFLKACPPLSCLSISQCDNDTLGIVSGKRHHMKRIDIFRGDITFKGLQQLTAEARHELENLTIMEILIDDLNEFCDFIKGCPNLNTLSINTRNTGPTDQLLIKISEYCPALEFIVIGGKGPEMNLTHQVMIDFIQGFQLLKLLVMDECPLNKNDIKMIQHHCREVLLRPAPKLVLSIMTKRNLGKKSCNVL